jgi:hypothetical protein
LPFLVWNLIESSSRRPSKPFNVLQRIKSGKRDQTGAHRHAWQQLKIGSMLTLCVSGYQVYAKNHVFLA